uniref:Uncharacterized protein n=1 Tax=Anguilla anguilla TaxID=7936 RepID=A0A0E9XU62_ANGAN
MPSFFFCLVANTLCTGIYKVTSCRVMYQSVLMFVVLVVESCPVLHLRWEEFVCLLGENPVTSICYINKGK